MGQMVIRNLDDALIAALRQRAAVQGTSTEEQARRALASALGLDRAEIVRRLREFREKVGQRGGPSILEDLRRDRDRDKS